LTFVVSPSQHLGVRKRILIGASVVLLLVVGAAVLLVVTAPGSGDYDDVTSIEEDPTFQDDALLTEAWALPVARLYADRVAFQENGSRCGPASTANILGSMGDEDDTEEEVLEDTGYCWTGFCIPGLTLDEVADMMRHKTDAEVTVLRDFDLETFREHLRASNDPSRRYLTNFHRGPLFGRGGGHHSPFAGYLEDRDLVLVIDVNEEYRPWLVSSERLFEAIDTIDGSTGERRGLILVVN
jgi:hypothetical protein